MILDRLVDQEAPAIRDSRCACVFRLDAVASARSDRRQLRRRSALRRCSRMQTGGTALNRANEHEHNRERRDSSEPARPRWRGRVPHRSSLFLVVMRQRPPVQTTTMNLVEANAGTRRSERGPRDLTLPATTQVVSGGSRD